MHGYTEIDAIVLAGGQGQRFGGEDKGWISWRNQPLISHVLYHLRPQVRDIVISCNRNLERYQNLGFPVATDADSDFAGPLAGISAALPHTHSEWVFVTPCDTPLLPNNIVSALAQKTGPDHQGAVVVHDGQQLQNLCLLFHREAAQHIPPLLAQGKRSVKAWLDHIGFATLHIHNGAAAFVNINRPEDLQALSTGAGLD